jgi:succinate dehydrogenase/fumarate reductase flavoprotein subunit
LTFAADIIVVGSGGAGLSAASEAAQRGRSVLVVEKAETLGGTTAIAVGSLMASATDMQRRAGIEDSPRRHEAELVALGQALGLDDNAALRRILVENVPDTVDFLASIGVDFLGPLLQPPFHTKRFYQALPGGRAYVHRLARHCRKLGVAFRLGTAATALATRDGRVVGIEVERGGARERIEARAVVLASGDFSANRAMRRELMGEGADLLDPINPNATGDGQRMAEAVGARLALRPDLTAARLAQARFAAPPGASLIGRLPPWRIVTLTMKLALTYLPSALTRPLVLRAAMTALAPERALFEDGAILVNREGRRFTDELALPAEVIARQSAGEAFMVLDARIADKYERWPHYVSTAPGVAFAYIDDYRRVRKDIFHAAQSIEALAPAIGAPAAALAETVAASRLGMGPYVAMGPLKAWMLLTHIGLAVNTRFEVLDAGGAPIPGLYAAGGAGQGGFSSLYHGHSLGWALTSGRLAGRAAAFDCVT